MKRLILLLLTLSTLAYPRTVLGRASYLRWTGHGREYIGWRHRTAIIVIVREWDGWWACERTDTGSPGRIIGGPFRSAERARERAEVAIK